MKKELEQQLIAKYPYLFAEMERSQERKKKHEEFMNRIHAIRDQQIKTDDESKRQELEEQIKAIREERSHVEPYWPIAFGFECDDGWYDLLDELMGKIQELDKNKQIIIHQIKEKYAGLRFYTAGGPSRIDIIGEGSYTADGGSDEEAITNLIHNYEDKSFEICEVCGKPGRVCMTRDRWLKTVCKEHRRIKISHSNKEFQEYIPCYRFHTEEEVITEDNKLLKVVELNFNETEDEWFMTLSDGRVVNQKNLKRVPASRFFKNQYVTKDDTLAGWIIKDKNFDPVGGWQYVLEPDDSVLGITTIIAKEAELTAVFITDENGYNFYKRLKVENTDKNNADSSVSNDDNV
jgi:hypothetical protein